MPDPVPTTPLFADAFASQEPPADERPRRSLLVLGAAIVFSAATAALFVVVLLALDHAFSLGDAMSVASAQTGLVPAGVKQIGLYSHDVVTIVVGVALLIVMVRANQRLYQGSTSGRTTVCVLAGLLSVGCLMSGWLWGATAQATGVVQTDSFDRRYMASLVAVQRLHAFPGADSLVKIAIIGVPLASLAIITLLNLPSSRAYFDAMRRSGTY